MQMKQLYLNLLSLISQITGISPDEILGTGKAEEIADARYLLFLFLSSYFTNKEISMLTGMRHARISYMINSFRSRSDKFSVRMNKKAIEEAIAASPDLYNPCK